MATISVKKAAVLETYVEEIDSWVCELKDAIVDLLEPEMSRDDRDEGSERFIEDLNELNGAVGKLLVRAGVK